MLKSLSFLSLVPKATFIALYRNAVSPDCMLHVFVMDCCNYKIKWDIIHNRSMSCKFSSIVMENCKVRHDKSTKLQRFKQPSQFYCIGNRKSANMGHFTRIHSVCYAQFIVGVTTQSLQGRKCKLRYLHNIKSFLITPDKHTATIGQR